ncbi:MAG: hypothetical protein JNK82_39890 [Myxococcaceae bacterium]|nr:hypothetical protein [Myxococcaceae bacterium]
MFRITTVIVFVALTAGCATTQAVEARNPYPREKGKAAAVNILGASYTVPANFDLVHHVDKPGIFGLELVDRTTACEGVMNFETTTDPAQVRAFTNENVDEMKRAAEQKGLKVDLKTEDFKALGQTGRAVVITFSNPADRNDNFYMSRYELFVPDQSIAYHGYVECVQNPLRAKTLDVARAVIDSRAASSDGLVGTR